MSKLTIVARITAKPGKVGLVKEELMKLVPATRAEAGCLNYDLHQDQGEPAHFLFYENWETRDHWLAHMEAPHIREFQAKADEMVADVAVYEMDPIG
ncbi:putative quinol monooxygenase [Haloferula sp. A504]|uniref:putative quinol monooxygenase n=1 Tax=Haloferula sp. A504 TaxID=3373601 RepID=UPI0031C04CA3|nr:antibiotic biosynthesis monooxygenase [Verrucomicrobiaceae bacterium E54]